MKRPQAPLFLVKKNPLAQPNHTLFISLIDPLMYCQPSLRALLCINQGVLTMCLLMCLVVLFPPVSFAAESTEDYLITKAKFSEIKGTNYYPYLDHSAKEGRWHDVILPHNWDNASFIKQRDGWYAIDYKLDKQPNNIWAIYLPRLNMNLAVYVNGSLLNAGGSFEEPMARNWNRPLLFVIPDKMLHQGNNEIIIHVKAYLNSGGGLGNVYIGPLDILERDYKWQFRTFISTTIISCAMTVALGLAMFLFWYVGNKEPMFFWFALANLFSAFYLSNHFIQNIPVSRHLWEWAFHCSIDAFVVCLMVFTHRWLNFYRPRTEKLLFAWLLLSMVVLYFFPEEMMLQGFSINHTVFVFAGGYIMFILLQKWKSSGNHWLMFPCLALLFLFLFSAHDWQQLWYDRSNNDHYLMPLAEPIFLFVISVFMLRNFILMHRQAAHFSEELQYKVQLATEEIEAQHEQLKELEHKQLIEAERERILQELHDGIGGQLVSAISLAEVNHECSALKQTLENALLDMRLVIESLDEDARNLSSLLGMVRFRLASHIQNSGVQMRWNIDPDIDVDTLGYEKRLNLLRIVQESITNALRHSKAKCIEVHMVPCVERKGVLLKVIDDGCGLGEYSPGRGLGHMRQRAERIGADLKIQSTSMGTEISVCMPDCLG